jgi:hypothetical protein
MTKYSTRILPNALLNAKFFHAHYLDAKGRKKSEILTNFKIKKATAVSHRLFVYEKI